MLKGLLKLFFVLAGLFAAVAGLGYLGRKNADQYIEIYGDEDDEEEAF
ncbi:hypothetical protein H8S23_04645 [Anaerofilum sp. BX8]|uniref:Uncharacterized protein n=1 Tax=Anaerofilum hominis TaxID=2763016 RepID=A0A923I5P1_9FIRM|nr:hypothetical protein [Anaerofilum hominis]MBC5580786.1 hypothetical protein [Anaerofilum hominis]